MSVHLEGRCWLVQDAAGNDWDEERGHYADEQHAIDLAAEANADLDLDGLPARWWPLQSVDLCFIAACDACGYQLDEAETVYHWPDPRDVDNNYLADNEWGSVEVTINGAEVRLIFCPEHVVPIGDNDEWAMW